MAARAASKANSMMRICLAGITGKVGRELSGAIRKETDFDLVSGVSRTAAGTLCDGVPIFASVEEALRDIETDILVDYTHPSAVKNNVLHAVKRGVRGIIGTSGLNDEDYAGLASAAESAGVGIIAAGNFSISATLLKEFAVKAARFMKRWEILDYGSATKPDAPSGTARELAFNLRDQVEECAPHREAVSRGLELNASPIHSLRLPGIYSGVEIQFGSTGERLIIRHESSGVEPYVAGTLLAIRRVVSVTGLIRGSGEF